MDKLEWSRTIYWKARRGEITTDDYLSGGRYEYKEK